MKQLAASIELDPCWLPLDQALTRRAVNDCRHYGNASMPGLRHRSDSGEVLSCRGGDVRAAAGVSRP